MEDLANTNIGNNGQEHRTRRLNINVNDVHVNYRRYLRRRNRLQAELFFTIKSADDYMGIPAKAAKAIFGMLDIETRKNVRLVSSKWRAAMDLAIKPNGTLFKQNGTFPASSSSPAIGLWTFENTIEFLENATFFKDGFGALKIQNCNIPFPPANDVNKFGIKLPKCEKLIIGHGNNQINLIKILKSYCDLESYPTSIYFGSDCFRYLIADNNPFQKYIKSFELWQVLKEIGFETYKSTMTLDKKLQSSEAEEAQAYINHMTTLMNVFTNGQFRSIRKVNIKFNEPCRLTQHELTRTFMQKLKVFFTNHGIQLENLDVTYSNEKWTRMAWDTFQCIHNVHNINLKLTAEHSKNASGGLLKTLEYANNLRNLKFSYPFRELHPILQKVLQISRDSLESLTFDSYRLPPLPELFQFANPPRFINFSICTNLTKLQLTNATILLDLTSPLLPKLANKVEKLRSFSIQIVKFKFVKYGLAKTVPDTRNLIRPAQTFPVVLDANDNLVLAANDDSNSNNNVNGHSSTTTAEVNNNNTNNVRSNTNTIVNIRPSPKRLPVLRRESRERWREIGEWISRIFPKLETFRLEDCRSTEEKTDNCLEMYQIQSIFYIHKPLIKLEIFPKTFLSPLKADDIATNKCVGIEVKTLSRTMQQLTGVTGDTESTSTRSTGVQDDEFDEAQKEEGYEIRMDSRHKFHYHILTLLLTVGSDPFSANNAT